MSALATKAFALFLSLALAAGSLAGCGSKEAESNVRVIENPKVIDEAQAEYNEAKAKAETKKGSKTEKPAEEAPEKPAEPVPETPAEPEKPAEPEVPRKDKAQSDVTRALVDKAAEMQDYSHEPGKDAAPIDKVDDNILILANKTHPLSKNYKADDMEAITKYTEGVGTEETHKMRKVAAEALYKLFDGAKADGYDIRLRTGYRSYSYQNTLYTNYVKKSGEAAANRYSAKPGESEHQTGLCCDVGVNGVSLTGFNDRPEAKWIAEHAHEYGFILRYPADKEAETGYMYESWHIRYVGIEAATEIWQQGICLEEYLGVTD